MNVNPWENKEWYFLGGAVVGAVVALVAGPYLLVWVAAGAVLGLAFAPQPGRETRHEIIVRARRWGSRIADFVAPPTGWNEEEILSAAVPPAAEP